MYYIENLPNVVTIGRVGENNFQTLQIDMTEWLKDMPDGIPSLVVIRPGETDDDAYIADTTFSNNILTWVITSSDTAKTGTGTIQVWLEELDGTTTTRRGKSAMIATRVYEAIGQRTVTPAPQQPWMDQMTNLSAQTVSAKNAAVAAKDAAVEAQHAAETAAGVAIAQSGQLKFYIDTSDRDGHLIMCYTEGVPIAEEETV